MTMMKKTIRRIVATAYMLLSLSGGRTTTTNGFTIQTSQAFGRTTAPRPTTLPLHMSTATRTTSFIETELRGAAMRLHTTKQAPKEGKVIEEEQAEPYVPTHSDYLQFLVDSQHVYQALEDIVNEREELKQYRNTGLERVLPLETDICWMCQEFNLVRPPVGTFGKDYAAHLRSIITAQESPSIPQFMCHYYNFYFAHTSGGRMIGKQMAALLLNKKTLEFYKWDTDLNKLKASVKDKIENMAATWDASERQQCIDATAMAFRGGGGINAHLNGGKNKH